MKNFVSFFLHHCTVYVMCLLFVILVFENKNNLLVKKQSENRILSLFMASFILQSSHL